MIMNNLGHLLKLTVRLNEKDIQTAMECSHSIEVICESFVGANSCKMGAFLNRV